ncbi:MAG: type II toxin-antitoxin system VapC family toxin [Methylococcaceae bacterium]|nr:type II toxin-antitoxin system VapC family toxin [Methylococcaceae bacterium]MDP2393022.1 type II toxin-antitoxin system VapC family toxin [Methylococcaceae bacterium]MDP3018646.1 type II toxin-antitoxin system VapC family toxin [Methylococcaceae bacterium]MDP3390577.1 type II toxin-antitoxin system VapC family toxin [Methylococcaceae bacterium]MDZ4155697.1 type II toxin-antitoxin system VapC family toxin [Methylococcales bacterium]
MPYLLDTDILSAIRRKQRDPNLEKWLHSIQSADVYLSVVTLGEVERGISQQRRNNPEFAEDLERWLDTILLKYEQRILPLSVSIARRWGKLSGELGHTSADLMIAATALEHNLTVATRNTRHFEPTQVSLINPYLY